MPTHVLILSNGADTAAPVHAILINFTAALLPTSVLFDLLGALLKRDSLRAAAWWTLLIAAILTPLTAAAGWLWWWSDPGEHSGHWQMPVHQWLGTALALALIPAAIWRGRIQRRSGKPGWAWGVCAAALLAAVTAQGELGGSMFFGRGLVVRSAPSHTDLDHGAVGEGDQHEHGEH